MGAAFGLVLTSPETQPEKLLALIDAAFEQLEHGLDL